mgnify:CR=1 FL=1
MRSAWYNRGRYTRRRLSHVSGGKGRSIWLESDSLREEKVSLMRMKVSDYIAQKLVDEGITDAFMVTGGGAMHLDDGLGHQPGLHCYFNHHEQACAIAAEAYARIHNKIAALCVTTGPGGTNAITGVVGGWLDSIPMLVLSGQVRYDTTAHSTGLGIRAMGDQEFEITKEFLDIRITAKEGFAVAMENNIFTILDTTLTPELIDEGLARELISKVQQLRKQADYEMMDQIVITVDADDAVKAAVAKHADYIKSETLAVELKDGACENTYDLNGHKTGIQVARV